MFDSNMKQCTQFQSCSHFSFMLPSLTPVWSSLLLLGSFYPELTYVYLLCSCAIPMRCHGLSDHPSHWWPFIPVKFDAIVDIFLNLVTAVKMLQPFNSTNLEIWCDLFIHSYLSSALLLCWLQICFLRQNSVFWIVKY
jgi:hypothetical protein